MQDGKAPGGGAIFVDGGGQLELEGCTLRNNTATGDELVLADGTYTSRSGFNVLEVQNR